MRGGAGEKSKMTKEEAKLVRELRDTTRRKKNTRLFVEKKQKESYQRKNMVARTDFRGVKGRRKGTGGRKSS